MTNGNDTYTGQHSLFQLIKGSLNLMRTIEYITFFERGQEKKARCESREIILTRREPGGSARTEKRSIIGQYGPRLSIIGRAYLARWSNKSTATTGLPKREFPACCRRHKWLHRVSHENLFPGADNIGHMFTVYCENISYRNLAVKGRERKFLHDDNLCSSQQEDWTRRSFSDA